MVAEILAFYINNGAKMFDKASIFRRLQTRFKASRLPCSLRASSVQQQLSVLLRSSRCCSLSCATRQPIRPGQFQTTRSRNTTTRRIPPAICTCRCGNWCARVRQLQRIFPRNHYLGDKSFVFVDGAVTMYNNPAFQMFMMATVDRYWINAPPERRGWKTGTDKMLIVSVGTGTSAGENYSLQPDEMQLLFNATTIPSGLM